jgi:hypothetical protein
VMTPGDTLPPLQTHRTPLFRRGISGGCRKHLPRGGFSNGQCVSRPAPGWGGVAPYGDGVVVVLVVTDPLSLFYRSPPSHPEESRAGVHRIASTGPAAHAHDDARTPDETTRAPQRQFRVQAARSIWRSHQAALSGRNGTPQLLASDGSSSRVPDHNCIMITAKRRPAPRSRAARGPPATS